METEFRGLIAAPPTPLGDDGELNLPAVERQAQALAADGVVGAFICGTTGEGVSLRSRERMALAQRWREVTGRDFRLIVHVGHLSAAEGAALAAHAELIGADAVAAAAPSFFKPAGVAEAVDYCARIAGSVKLPFYYYHLPALTGVRIPVAEILSAGAGRIRNLAGAKFTDDDLMDFGRCLHLGGGRFEMFFGTDEILLSALALGARGAVGTTYNFAAPLYRRVVEAFAAGDLATARAEQARAMEMISILYRFGAPPVWAKAVMKMIGLDCGPPRTPLRPLTGERFDALRAALERIGFFEFRRPPASTPPAPR